MQQTNYKLFKMQFYLLSPLSSFLFHTFGQYRIYVMYVALCLYAKYEATASS